MGNLHIAHSGQMQVQDLLFEGTELTVDPLLQLQQPLLIQQMLFRIGTRIRLQQIQQLVGFRVRFAALSARTTVNSCREMHRAAKVRKLASRPES